MPARFFSLVGFALVAFGVIAEVSAEVITDAVTSIAKDVKRRQCWPEPFVGPDRVTARAPFVVQVTKGWQRQNMLGEFHFEPETGQLTEAGRHKVRWILTAGPQQHRFITVHTAERPEETQARLAAVQQLAAQITPDNVPSITPISISDQGWPADQVDLITRKYQATMPAPRLPAPSSGGSGGGSGMSTGTP